MNKESRQPGRDSSSAHPPRSCQEIYTQEQERPWAIFHKIWDLGFPENWIEPHSVQSSGAFAWLSSLKTPSRYCFPEMPPETAKAGSLLGTQRRGHGKAQLHAPTVRGHWEPHRHPQAAPEHLKMHHTF